MNGKDESAGTPPERELICPLLALRPQTLDDSVRRLVKATDPNACIGERCAWWDSDVQACVMLRVSMALKSLPLN